MKEFKRKHVDGNRYRQFYEIQATRPHTTNVMKSGRRLPTHWALKEILSYKKPPCDILDIGTQSGKNAILLSLLFYNVTAIDVSELYIKKSKENASVVADRIQWHCLPVEKVLTLNKKFDVVLCLSVLEHVENFQTAMEAMISVTKKGSLMLFIVPIEESWLTNEHTRIFKRDSLTTDFPSGSEVGTIIHSQDKKTHGWFTIKYVV